jgi:hypothetical protein
MPLTHLTDEDPDEPQPHGEKYHDAVTDEIEKPIMSTFDD